MRLRAGAAAHYHGLRCPHEDAERRRSRPQRILLPHIQLPSPSRLGSLPRSSCTAPRSMCHVVRQNPTVCPPAPLHVAVCELRPAPLQHNTHTARAPPMSVHDRPERSFLAALLPAPLAQRTLRHTHWYHEPSDVAAGLRCAHNHMPISTRVLCRCRWDVNARCAPPTSPSHGGHCHTSRPPHSHPPQCPAAHRNAAVSFCPLLPWRATVETSLGVPQLRLRLGCHS